jgi:mono/diheme cytochrome c family protein
MPTLRTTPPQFGRRAGAAAALVVALALPLVAGADGHGAQALPIEAAQVEAGAAVYAQSCRACHGAELEGMASFPQLAGEAFRGRWVDRPLGELYTYVHTMMPLGAGGSLPDEAYAAVVAYLLARNGVEAGEVPFDPAQEEQLALPIGFGG